MTTPIRVPEARSWLHRLFVLRHLAEQVFDAAFTGVEPPAGARLLIYNETDAGLGDAAFAHKLVVALSRQLPTVELLLVAVETAKHAVFATETLLPVLDVAGFKGPAGDAWRRPDLVLSAPAIFDHCRDAATVLNTLGLPSETPFLYLAEHGSIRQLRDDALKALLAGVEATVERAMDSAAAAAGVAPDDVGYRGGSGEIVAIVDDKPQAIGSLLEYAATEEGPLASWLSQPMVSARSSGLEAGESGVFAGFAGHEDAPHDAVERLESIGDLSDTATRDALLDTESLHSGYAHGGHGVFLAYLAALEQGADQRIDVVSPTTRSAKRALTDFVDDVTAGVLGELGVGAVEVVGNAADEVKLGEVCVARREIGAGKLLRVITRHPLPYADFQLIQRLASPVTMVSGDQSFCDAVTAGKAVLVVEPMYCQTWALDAQIAMAERVSAPLAKVLRFATAAKWDAGNWPQVLALLTDRGVVDDAQRWAAEVREQHNLATRLPGMVSRALWTHQDPTLAAEQVTAWKQAWAQFSVVEGLSVQVPTTRSSPNRSGQER